jgi:DNA-binding LacI/PurR family transcriptional regulator
MAIGVLQACRAGGVSVPRDLSVVGWDDVPCASVVQPALTTVRVPRYEFGQAAARRLLTLMRGVPAGPPEPPLRLELVRRESCRRPRAASAQPAVRPARRPRKARA